MELKKESNVELLTVKDIQQILGCGITQAYNLMNSKGFPSIRINRRLYVQKKTFERWLNLYEGKQYNII